MTDSSAPEFLVVGHVSKAHGTKGEVYVWPLTNRGESTFTPGASFQVAAPGSGRTPGGERPDPLVAPLVIAESRDFRDGWLVRFQGVEDRNTAERIRDRYLLRPSGEVAPLDEGEVFYHQLLGSRVVTVSGEEVGEVTEVYDRPPVDLLEVRRGEGVVLIPFTEAMVVEVDPQARLVRIDPPEGLLDL
jgi:16S rRNA processing protein RimM